MRIRSYSTLRQYHSFEDRYHYLALKNSVGDATFGFDRHINQQFYQSSEWRSVRRDVIVRDNGCDLGVDGYEIHGKIYIHHMNPMNVEDIINGEDYILDPEYLICVTHQTHNAIHYGDERQLPKKFEERAPGDTALWKRR